MRRLLLVSYNPTESDFNIKKILEQQPYWWHHLQTTWIVKTPDTPGQLYNRLAPYLKNNDRIIVVEITKNYEGWLPQNAWDWLNEQKNSY